MSRDFPDIERINDVVGLLTESEQFEGVSFESSHVHGLVMMTEPDPGHRRIIRYVADALDHLRAGHGWEVDSGQMFRTGTGLNRTPDLFVLDPDLEAPFQHGRSDSMSGVRFVLEVTSSNRGNDFEKVTDYAASGVPVYVIVDRKARETLIYSEPGSRGYGDPVRHPLGTKVWIPEPVGVWLDTGPMLQHV